MKNLTEKSVQINGTDIHYYRTGGGKPALVLLHGYTDDALCWQKVVGDLRNDYDVLIPDARGHGNSGGIQSGFSVPLMANDTAKLIQLERMKEPIVFGHSMGAAVAAQLAAQNPDLIQAIILEDPPLMKTIDEMTQEEIEKSKHAAKEHLKEFSSMPNDPYDEVVKRISKQYPDWDIDDVKWWIDAKLRFDFDNIPPGGALRSFVWREVFANIKCPVLLLFSDQDRGGLVTKEQADEIKNLFDLVEAIHINNAGHCIHRDRYQDTIQVIFDFLERFKDY